MEAYHNPADTPIPLFPDFLLDEIAERWLIVEKRPLEIKIKSWEVARRGYLVKEEQIPPMMSLLENREHRVRIIEDNSFWSYLTGRQKVEHEDWQTLKATIASLCLEPPIRINSN